MVWSVIFHLRPKGPLLTPWGLTSSLMIKGSGRVGVKTGIGRVGGGSGTSSLESVGRVCTIGLPLGPLGGARLSER